MSSIITNLSVIQGLAEELVKPHQLNYSQQCMGFYINDDRYNIEHIHDVKNRDEHMLKSTLITEKGKRCSNGKCIIFLHGLGSTRLEAFPMVEALPEDYSLFCFDFSGSGKSEGSNITYGLKEAEDVQAVMEYLISRKGFLEFVIWGRSMGAVAALLYAMNQAPNKREAVKALVLDSPFHNFESITKHIALKKVSLPHFLIDVALHFIKQTFDTMLYDQEKQRSYNPFQINFNSEIKLDIPAIFLYSLTDDVVPKEHSEQIIKQYRGQYERIVMQDCAHNDCRPKYIQEQIYQTLRKFENKAAYFKRSSCNRMSRMKSLDRRQSMEYRGQRGISLCTGSKQKSRQQTTTNKSPTRKTQYNTLKVQPHAKKTQLPRSPRILSRGKYKKKLQMMEALNTISYSRNPQTQKVIKTSMSTQEALKRRNSHVYNLRRKQQLQIQLNHTRYL